jgi:stearoyl-CoA desaturase (delta-9 desaturase)
MQKIFELNYKSAMIFQIIATLCFLYLLYAGTLSQWLIALSVYFVRIIITSSILHRKISHRAFNTHKWLEYSLATLGVVGGHSSVITWVAVHRQHHRYPDVEKDPHSPKYNNILKIHFQRISEMPSMMYVPDLVRSKFYVASHQWHWLIGLAFIFVLYLIDPMAVIYAWFVPLFIHWHAGCLVNSLNHLNTGYRNYDTKDQSNNHFLTGYLAAGEGWHNNHHNAPASPQFGERWWELDVSWWFIKLIRVK